MAETKCDSCGTITECVPVCGAFGAITYSCCLKCLAEGGEPYRNIVDYVAAYYVYMGGCDVIAFTAGMGENLKHLRANVINRLGV